MSRFLKISSGALGYLIFLATVIVLAIFSVAFIAPTLVSLGHIQFFISAKLYSVCSQIGLFLTCAASALILIANILVLNKLFVLCKSSHAKQST